MKRGLIDRFRYLAMPWVEGSIALALATWVCLQRLNFATTALVLFDCDRAAVAVGQQLHFIRRIVCDPQLLLRGAAFEQGCVATRIAGRKISHVSST